MTKLIKKKLSNFVFNVFHLSCFSSTVTTMPTRVTLSASRSTVTSSTSSPAPSTSSRRITTSTTTSPPSSTTAATSSRRSTTTTTATRAEQTAEKTTPLQPKPSQIRKFKSICKIFIFIVPNILIFSLNDDIFGIIRVITESKKVIKKIVFKMRNIFLSFCYRYYS